MITSNYRFLFDVSGKTMQSVNYFINVAFSAAVTTIIRLSTGTISIKSTDLLFDVSGKTMHIIYYFKNVAFSATATTILSLSTGTISIKSRRCAAESFWRLSAADSERCWGSGYISCLKERYWWEGEGCFSDQLLASLNVLRLIARQDVFCFMYLRRNAESSLNQS